jgi:hypothetical protein
MASLPNATRLAAYSPRLAAILLGLGVTFASPRPARALDPADEGPTAADGQPVDTYADADPSALTDFRPVLDEHGAWVDDESYGTVWVPNGAEVGPDFTPYVSNGRWLYEDEYVWASDYSWGWVPFHYGRWVWSGLRGWVWIPGRAYAGAWVVWRLAPDGSSYLGWAPMSPAWAWVAGMAMGLTGSPQSPFVFCPREDVFSPVVGTRVVRGEPAGALLADSHPYVPATPVVGRPRAHAVVQGPPPAVLGIDASRIARVPIDDRRVRRAQVFARPSTAMPIGARPPAPHIVRVLPPRAIVPTAPMHPVPVFRGVRPRR